MSPVKHPTIKVGSKVFITKHVLTKGILELEVYSCCQYTRENKSVVWLVYIEDIAYRYALYHLDKDAFVLEEDAVRDAIKRCDSKLKSIEKSRVKVTDLRLKWSARLGRLHDFISEVELEIERKQT